MPPNEGVFVLEAKLRRMAQVIADANVLKSSKSYKLDDVRTAEAEALDELALEYDSVEEVEAIELPSERV